MRKKKNHTQILRSARLVSFHIPLGFAPTCKTEFLAIILSMHKFLIPITFFTLNDNRLTISSFYPHVVFTIIFIH